MKYLPLIGTLKMPFIKNKKLHICSTRCMDVSAKIISRSDPNQVLRYEHGSLNFRALRKVSLTDRLTNQPTNKVFLVTLAWILHFLRKVRSF